MPRESRITYDPSLSVKENALKCGVTVDAKRGKLTFKGYNIEITDLPGTYALSAYSPEEMYVRHHLMDKMPDVVINAVVASNIERNLFLTTELIDLNPKMVVALNMYDEKIINSEDTITHVEVYDKNNIDPELLIQYMY